LLDSLRGFDASIYEEILPFSPFFSGFSEKRKKNIFCAARNFWTFGKNPCQVRHFVISLSILIAAGSIFECRLV